jgi:hypothetical protein
MSATRADVNQPYYLETGVNVSIAQQVFGPVDFVARFGASNLAYRDRAGAPVDVSDRVDHYRTYGVGAGYHLGRICGSIQRRSSAPHLGDHGPEMRSWRYGTSVTYGF